MKGFEVGSVDLIYCRNTVRHHLSSEPDFVKVQRGILDPGRGNHWMVMELKKTEAEIAAERIKTQNRTTKSKKATSESSSVQTRRASQAAKRQLSGSPDAASTSLPAAPSDKHYRVTTRRSSKRARFEVPLNPTSTYAHPTPATNWDHSVQPTGFNSQYATMDDVAVRQFYGM